MSDTEDELMDDVRHWKAVADGLRAELAQSAALVEELRACLDPFAKISLWRDIYPDAKDDFLAARQMQGYVKVPDIRRARAEFSSTEYRPEEAGK